MHICNKLCCEKPPIRRFGLFIMWNRNMIDKDGKKYYLIEKLSKIDMLFPQYAKFYCLPLWEIKCEYNLLYPGEKFAKKVIYKLFERYKICNICEQDNVKKDNCYVCKKKCDCCCFFDAPLEVIKKFMERFQYIVLNYKVKKNYEKIMENFDLFINRFEKFFEELYREGESDFANIVQSANLFNDII